MTNDVRIPTVAGRSRNTTPAPIGDGANPIADTALPAARSNAAQRTRQPAEPVSVGVAEVGAAHRRLTSARWFGVLSRLRNARLEARTARRTNPTRRGDFMERAAMAREMHRL
jgi:hypothetical protein